jgi:Flp pilus assembly protein TadG
MTEVRRTTEVRHATEDPRGPVVRCRTEGSRRTAGRRSTAGRCRATGRGGTASRREAGNAPLELMILAPVIMLLICLVIAAGRTTIAQGSVDAAARDAARQASIARSPEAAVAAAYASARSELSGENLNCTPVIQMPGVYRDFAAPVGTPAAVTARVTCRVSLADLLIPGLPGSKTLRASFTSPIDPYRGRTS